AQQQAAVDAGGKTQLEAGHGESGAGVDVAARGDAPAVRSDGRAEIEGSDGVVNVDLVFAPAQDAGAHLEAVAASGISHVVEILERREVVQLGGIAAGTQVADVAGAEGDLGHGGGSITDIHAGDADLPGEVEAEIDGREDQPEAVEAETELVEPAG